MSKRNHVLALLLIAVAYVADAEFDAVGRGIGGCWSSVTANAGTVLVCPLGDGDLLTAPVGGGNCQITLTVRELAGPIAGMPATDMWLIGCNNGLLLCGGNPGSDADAATNAAGTTTFSSALAAGGCDTGLYAVVQGVVVCNPDTGVPSCLTIAVRSPDYKSAGAPGPAPCAGDIRCPDSKISNADFSWFVTHYPTGANPGAPYLACADYSRFTVHFAGAGHKCPI